LGIFRPDRPSQLARSASFRSENVILLRQSHIFRSENPSLLGQSHTFRTENAILPGQSRIFKTENASLLEQGRAFRPEISDLGKKALFDHFSSAFPARDTAETRRRGADLAQRWTTLRNEEIGKRGKAETRGTANPR
jgi:hypothetical protein